MVAILARGLVEFYLRSKGRQKGVPRWARWAEGDWNSIVVTRAEGAYTEFPAVINSGNEQSQSLKAPESLKTLEALNNVEECYQYCVYDMERRAECGGGW